MGKNELSMEMNIDDCGEDVIIHLPIEGFKKPISICLGWEDILKITGIIKKYYEENHIE